MSAVVVVVSITARKTVDIIIPTAVIKAPIVSPSRLDNSRNFSEKSLVLSFIIVFIF